MTGINLVGGGATELPTALRRGAQFLGTLDAPTHPPPLSDQAIRERLDDPIWPNGARTTIFDLIRPGERVCLVVSDHTRKTAADRVLPVVLDGIRRRGCRSDDLFVLIASGIHRHPTTDEIRAILGPAAWEALADRVFLHDPDDEASLVRVGRTRRGHEVRVNRRAVDADRLVLTGAATYHYHAGFGGGRKSLVPGLAARDTIAHNHSLSLDPEADRFHPTVGIGRLDGNPVAEEMLEAAALCRPAIIINSVLTPSGQLVGLFSGELDAAHRAACTCVEQVCRVDIAEQADLVIASAGTASNWVQSHKALFNAHRATKETGHVILEAPCPEGLGDDRFRYWLRKPDTAAMLRELRKAAEVLGQTAFSTRLRRARTTLVTTLGAADVADLGMASAPDLATAVHDFLRARVERGAGSAAPTWYHMPQARYTVPFVSDTLSPIA